MSDQIVINVVQEAPANINVSDAGQNINLNPLTLNQGIINHSVTHQSGGSDELLHNLLGGLNGGQSGQYYHLSSGQYFNLVTGIVVRPSETGNFITTSQTGAFYPRSNPSGFITGLDTSMYVTGDVVRPSQTGDFYPRSNPSGFITGVDLSSYATQAYVTGVSGSLQIQITNLGNQTGSYVLNSQTGNFITVGQTGAFYPRSNPSGFITGVDLSNYSTISYTTGISGGLQLQINALSSQTGSYALQSQTGSFLTTGAADNRFVSSSGNQTIYGTKSFSNDVYINRLYVTGSETIVSTNNFSVQSPYVILNLTGGAVDGGIFFVTGSGLTGINDLGPIIGFDHSTNFKFGISTRASDLSSLPTIGSVEQINALSGYLDPKITALNNQTGSYALKSETGSFVTASQTGAFYAASNPSGFITGVDLSNYSTIAYTTGVSGFLQSQISNLNNATGSYALKAETGSFLTAASADALYVNVTGNETISGIKTFSNNITGNGTLVIDGNIQSNNGNVSASAAGSLSILGRSRIYSSSDGTLQFRNNANNANATGIFGSIGIGTGIPAQLLHVFGDGARIRIQSNNAFANPVLELVGTSFTNFLFAGSDGAWNMRTDSATRPVYIQSIGNQGGLVAQGNVQIGGVSGVSAPNSQLVIRSNFNNLTGNLLELQGYSGNQVFKVGNVGDLTSSGAVNATNLVYNTGNQTIAGIKTFSNNIVGNGTLNTLPNQTAASTDQTCIATQVMTTPFPTFGGSPPMYKIFEDFPVQNANSSYIGTHGWYYLGSISNPAFASTLGPLCYGAVQLTTTAVSGGNANVRLITNGTNAVGGYMHALFAIPDPTNAIFYMGFAGGGSSDYVQYVSASGGWITSKFTNPGFINNFIASGLLSGGNFVSGTRYKVSWGRPSETTTTVHIASAPWNSAVWTTFYNGTVTHSSWRGGFGQIQPHIGIATETAVAKSIIVDYVGIEYTTQR